MADDQNLNQDGGRKVVTTSGEFTKGTPEERFLISLRPTRFEDYVGQKNTVGSLKIATQAARKRGEVLDHVLLHGPPGLGKTTLATIISREMDSKIVNTSGPALERTADVVGLLSNLEQGDIFFIDEIHRLARSVEEYLYSAMEDFRVDFMTGSGAFARTISLPLQQFTLIGSTTRAGMLSAPLRDRFGLQYHLDFYSQEDLVKVIKRSASIIKFTIGDDATRRLRSAPVVRHASPTACSAGYATTPKSNTTDRPIATSPLRRWTLKGLMSAGSNASTDSTSRPSPSTTAADRPALRRSRRPSTRSPTRWPTSLSRFYSSSTSSSVPHRAVA